MRVNCVKRRRSAARRADRRTCQLQLLAASAGRSSGLANAQTAGSLSATGSNTACQHHLASAHWYAQMYWVQGSRGPLGTMLRHAAPGANSGDPCCASTVCMHASGTSDIRHLHIVHLVYVHLVYVTEQDAAQSLHRYSAKS